MWKQYRMNFWISVLFPTLCWLYLVLLVNAVPMLEEEAYQELDNCIAYFERSTGKSRNLINDEYFLIQQRAVAEKNHIINILPYPWEFNSGSMSTYLDTDYWRDDEGLNSIELSAILYYLIFLVLSQYRIWKIKKRLLINITYSEIFATKTTSLKKWFLLPFIQEILLYFWLFKDRLKAKIKNINEALAQGVISAEEAENKKTELMSQTKKSEAEHYFKRWPELKQLNTALSNQIISQDEYNKKYVELKKCFMSNRL
jgi:hypothetical protein